MNKIYKVVWSKARNCYVVASEFAKGHTKSTNRNKKNINARNIAAVIAVVLGMSVMPLGGTVFAEKVGDPKVISDEGYSAKSELNNLKGLVSADNNILFGENGKMGLQLKLAENIAVKSITTKTIKKSDGTELDLSNIIQGVRFDDKGNLYYTDSKKTEYRYGTVHDYTIANGSYDADSKKLTLTKNDAYGNQADSTVDIDLSNISNGLAQTNLSNITSEGETKITNLAADAVKVAAGKNTTVTEKIDEKTGVKTYTVNADDAAVVYEGNDDTKALRSTNAYENNGNNSIALGVNAQASGDNAVAIGNQSNAIGKDSVALMGTTAHGTKAMTWGDNSNVAGVAIKTESNSWGSSAVLDDNEKYIVATGEAARIYENATAFGSQNVAANDNATAFGIGNLVLGENGTAWGNDNVLEADANNGTVWGEDNVVSAKNATAWGEDNVASGWNATSFGDHTVADGENATAWGSEAKAYGENATAFGEYTIASGRAATSWGIEDTTAAGDYSTAWGDTRAYGKYATSFGDGSRAYGENSLAILGGTTGVFDRYENQNPVFHGGANAMAVGEDAQAKLDDSIALGSRAVADTEAGKVGYDISGEDHSSDTTGVWKSTENAISVGNVAEYVTRQITGVAAGSEDTDAVNVAQLKKVQETITGDVDNKTFGLADDNNKTVTKTLDNTVQVKGANGITSTVKDGALEIGLGNDITVGKDGKNGAAGLIGLVGKDGKDGLTTTTIKTEYGPAGVDGKDGITRIVYETKDGGKHEVATLDDGLKFHGDIGSVADVKLNKQVNITGGITDENKLSDNNIGVVTETDHDGNATLKVKLNKDLTGLNSVTTNNAYVTNVDESDNSVTNVKYVKNQIADATLKAGDGISIADKKINVKLKDGEQNLAVDNNGLSLKNDIALGDTSDTSVVISGSKGTIQASASIAAGNIIMDSHDGDITGLTNKTLDGKDFAQKGRAATEEQLKLVKDSITGDVDNKTFGLADDNKNTVTEKLNNTVQVKGTNGITSTVKDGALEIGLGNVITVGKDGAAGSIGLVGKDGKDGLTTTTIKTEYGPAGVDGKDGITRIIYETKDGDTTIKHEVATLDDGLKFQGDRGEVIAKKLNETLTIKGNAVAAAKLSDGNIGVTNENGSLIVKLNKDLTGLNSVTTGDTKMDTNGLTVGHGTSGLEFSKNRVSVGGQQIHDVEAGKDDMDAVNVSQLKGVESVANKGWNLSTNGSKEVTQVKPGETVDFSGDDNISVSNDGTNVTTKLNKDLKGIETISNGSSKVVLNEGYAGMAYGDTSIALMQDNVILNSKVTVGKDGKISGVAAGRIATDSTDAVNGSQLHAVQQEAGKHTKVVNGSNITVEENDQDGQKTYKVGLNKDILLGDATGKNVNISGTNGTIETTGYIATKDRVYADKGAKLADVDITKDTLSNGPSKVVLNEGYAGMAYGDTSIALMQDNVVLNSKVTVGKDGKISGVAAGRIAADSTDAVNGSQLHAVQQEAGKHTKVVNGSNITVEETDQDGQKTYKVGLNKDILLGDINGKYVSISGSNGTIDATGYIATKDRVYADKGAKLADVDVTGNTISNDKASVKLDKEGTVTINNTVTVDQNGKISGVAKGDISDTSTDAVNGSQLKETNDRVTNVENDVKNIQGDITNIKGDITTIKGDVTNLDNRVTEVEKTAGKHSSVSTEDTNIQITERTNTAGGTDYKLSLNKDLRLDSVTTGDTKMDTNGVTVGETVSLTKDGLIAGDTKVTNAGLSIGDKTYVSNDGLNANNQTITNVADGKVEKGSTDAVNGGQLYETNQAVINNANNISSLSHSLSNLDNRVNKVGAGAAALAALHPLDFDPDAKWDFAAGYGNYRGTNAAAIGAYYRPNEDTMFSVGGTFGNGENMVNAGVSFKLGAGSSHVSTSRVAMAKEIKELRSELEAMKSAMLDANAGKKINTSKLQLFPDVPQNHWAYEYITQLAGNGMIEGYPDGNFAGDRPMTRYEFAAILYRAMTKGAVLSDKILSEFSHELEYFTVDTVSKDKAGNPTIQRVRTVKANKNK